LVSNLTLLFIRNCFHTAVSVLLTGYVNDRNHFMFFVQQKSGRTSAEWACRIVK